MVLYMKIIKMVFLFVTICIISSCNHSFQKSSYIENLCEDIVFCFDKRDSEALKKMFCDEIQAKLELDSEIKTAFDKYNGTSLSYRVTDNHIDESVMRNGVYIMKRYVPSICDIFTDEEKEYTISFNTYELCDFKPSKEGITILVLYDDRGNQLAVIGGQD